MLLASWCVPWPVGMDEGVDVGSSGWQSQADYEDGCHDLVMLRDGDEGCDF